MAAKKVLMLHGYSQNAAIFSKRMGAVRKACGKDIDFVFVDAPHVLQPVDLAGLNTDALGASEANTTTPEPNPAELPRGWFRSNPERTIYAGVEESLSVLRDILAKDKFEGVFGFSQGAAMAALITAVLEKPELYPPILVDDQPPHPAFKFCVAVSGFKPNDPHWSRFFIPDYATPTLHIFGINDVIIPLERVRTLIDVSAHRVVATHDGGHFVPSKAPWRNFLRDYLKDPLGDVPVPPASDEASSIASLVASGLTGVPLVMLMHLSLCGIGILL
ncbi:FSH1-domain-containing protein [Fomitiporia mediterranea MF3/22]|uniref:FSH1-domain-containing protein n=1 Tax=Fomitiporia mediterranea (strain MF3/22) TaxID=694068 RepID=UPI00044078BC|nr:FSH1-domain-containing protein [Fomitiporia mediterranea MF3/22]EJD08107.1 FSH1-domain-containing protein [Fomitiporia mediterranea MF3/22]